MSAADSQPPPLRREQLAEFFVRAEKPDRATHRIGTELETFGVAFDDPAMPAPVRFARHVEPILRDLMDHGWAPGPQRGSGGELVELVRDGASITLEPGGQIELSGAPLPTLHHTCEELTRHYRELHQVSTPRQVAWIAAGYHPFATRDEIDWVPKGRYRIMRGYLPTRGERALDMMLRTCTVQANFDYVNEVDCGRRFRLALALGPLVTAMFANSPYEEGRASGLCSLRTAVWFDVDPDRCGVPKFMFDAAPFSYERYVDWALDVPMFFIQRDGRYLEHHAPFRDFLEHGLVAPNGARHRATWQDWELHLSTLFPEVRLKPFVEVRMADAVPSRFVCALPALWKGLLHDDDSLEAAWAVVADMDRATLLAMWDEARRAGLRSERIRSLCANVLAVARASLERQDVRDAKGRGEARFLDPMAERVATGTCPAAHILAALGPTPGRDPAARARLTEAFYFAGHEPAAAPTT